MNNSTTSHWFYQPCKSIDQQTLEQAREHQSNLTKPAGSLGLLEDIAIWFCGWQNTLKPSCNTILIRVFAADHGVCQQGVSAFPQEVTAQMIQNFISGGAAINVLARQMKAEFSVINMGITTPMDDAPTLVNTPLMTGTNDFTLAPAMSEQIMLDALLIGKEQVENRTKNQCADLFIGGDMGIGNTTSASAIYSLILELSPEITVGPGTGVDKSGIASKQKALYQAFNLHAEFITSPLDTLQRVGGLEIAGLVGAMIACAQQGTPILVDGFITTAAALLATKINPATRDWMFFSHQSAEPSHKHALQAMQASPLLDIGMRLGEGSGAAVAVPLIQSALALHNDMATFASADVTTKITADDITN